MQLVTVFTSLNPVDADLVCSRLTAAGFHPVISRGLEATAGFVLASGGVIVQVPDDEAANVRELLADTDEAPPA
jgi:hypothetical protein